VRLVQFGEFEFDVRAGELRRGQEKVRLQEQPYRILTMLLERPGEVVLREEICKRLWPNGTVVEVSHGINAAVLRLREALGDSAAEPRFIETVARRGYRLLAPVGVERSEAPAFSAGQMASHFRLEEMLGRGGMGVVYRAEDLTLNRLVAVKFLAPEMAGDPLAVSRFRREARTASALNHPNICTVYAVEECSGQPVIVMELLEGRTLESILAEGPLPVEKALPMALQMVAALEAAQRKGIVHRDLKPGNVMVTPFGVKVLDFGLAKQTVTTQSSSARRVSGAASLVGTPNYMAPELFQGREADGRSDLYSFGLMLFEMLAGGPSGAHLGRALPAAAADLEPVIRRALQANPEERWQSAGDLKAALECAAAARTLHPAIRRPFAERMAPFGAAAAVVAVIAFWIWNSAPMRPMAARQASPRTSVQPPAAPAVRLPGMKPEASGRLNLSPDGRLLAFAAGGEIYVRTIAGGESRLVVSEGGTAGTPFWSPDGRWLAYTKGGGLYTVAAKGGTPRRLGGVNTNIAGTWGPDGTILIGEVRGGLLAFSSTGGPSRRVTTPDANRGETRHLLPQFLPGGRAFLYTAGSDQPDGSALYAGSLDSNSRVRIMAVGSGATFVVRSGSKGYLVFHRDGYLMAQPFDAGPLRTEGGAVRLAGPVNGATAAAASGIGIAEASVTASTLVYRPATLSRRILPAAFSAGARGDVVVVKDWMDGLRF
jgi:DNA-binding winged helix-turn-helix (wHTH) protein